MNKEDKKYIDILSIKIMALSFVMSFILMLAAVGIVDKMNDRNQEWQCVEWEEKLPICKYVGCDENNSCTAYGCEREKVCVKEGLFRNASEGR